MIKYLMTIAFAIGLVASANAQDYQIRRAPFNYGYNVYGPAGGLQQTIRPAPFNNGYNVYGAGGGLQQEIRPLPFNTGYRVHTMPNQSSFNRW